MPTAAPTAALSLHPGAARPGAARLPRVRSAAALRTLARDYFELCKPRIAAMALVTVAVGFLLGVRAAPELAGKLHLLFHTLVGAGVVAAGGSALNHWLERRADARMTRTANRPVVAGRIAPAEAFAFGLTLSVLGVAYLWAALPTPAAAIAAAATAILYVAVYTPLKRVTAWNTVVGAIPGALPPVIGWCGANGGIEAPGWALFAVLFVWQLPHFYSIAFMHRDDYARGGMRMLPTVEGSDGRLTGLATAATAALLVLVTALPVWLCEWSGGSRWVYLAGAIPVAVWFLLRCVRFAQNRTVATARKVLRGSLVYLLLVMGLFILAGVAPRYFGG